MSSLVDLRSCIKLSQGGVNACFYLTGDSQYLWVADRVLTSKVTEVTKLDEGLLVTTGDGQYLVPAYLSTYTVTEPQMNHIQESFSKDSQSSTGGNDGDLDAISLDVIEY